MLPVKTRFPQEVVATKVVSWIRCSLSQSKRQTVIAL